MLSLTPSPQGGYEGMFSGCRIGGMPTVKLNIIGEELSMLERGSRPLPVSRPACSPHTRQRQPHLTLHVRQFQMPPGPAIPKIHSRAVTR
jgi:hypothetical protein